MSFDPQVRTAGELQRAARRLTRLLAHEPPWLVPMLVVTASEAGRLASADGHSIHEHLSDRPGLRSDPQFAFVSHSFTGDGPLALGVRSQLQQTLPHVAGRPCRWPERPGLVIVTDEARLALVREALPDCGDEDVLAVYVLRRATVECLAGPRFTTLRTLPGETLCQACASIRRDLGQALLREPATAWGQVLHERFTRS